MIVYACVDLMFASKVSATCDAAGVVGRPARSAAMLRARLDRVDDGKSNEAVSNLFVEVSREDALELITIAHEHPARPRVVAFGPHVDAARLEAARTAGADEVMARGAFAAQLPALVARGDRDGRTSG
ncbi:MAG: hypothetical protein AAGE65_03060 [Planctomycetota bacterium]